MGPMGTGSSRHLPSDVPPLWCGLRGSRSPIEFATPALYRRCAVPASLTRRMPLSIHATPLIHTMPLMHAMPLIYALTPIPAP